MPLKFQHKLKNSIQNKQYELFSSTENFESDFISDNNIKLTRDDILNWRNKIHEHQSKIKRDLNSSFLQESLIPSQENNLKKINPFLLTKFSINFWRSNKSVHSGPAMYFVFDEIYNSEIILYIGETNSADKRWKGDHDCKIYINNYKELLAENNIKNNLDIRFFLDVPKQVKFRRKLEQQLIYLWLPPFNKETRGRWSTTFTTK
tara:strand:- start:1241 stop:1855 length:615 start_codon:yes stop_codon:yes gene_type:complete